MNRAIAAAGAALLLAAATGCSAKSTSGSTGSDTSLVVGMNGTVQSLNPVKNGQSAVLVYLYDPLIYQSAEGKFVADLATSWRYVGADHKTFELKLRTDATFAEGTMLNATAVKKSIEYFLDTPNTNSSAVGPISKVDAVDDDTVRVHYSSAYPNAVSSLTQFYGLGMVIGPDGLKNPSSLDTTPDGVGQYKLNTGSTVSNSVYTYDANAAYFRPKAVRFKTVQVKVLPDNNARLAALKSGQIDYAVQLPLAQLGSKAAGDRRVLKSPSTWMVLFFANRASGPLAEPDVRKALNHAIDRKSLATGLYGGYALAQDQFSPTGAKGYDSDLGGTYSFDTAEAKSLLAKAGYANGLKIKVLDNGTVDPNGLLGAALKEQLAKVGVTVDLEVFSGPFNQFTTELTSNKYDAYVWNMFSQDMYTAANLYFAGSGMLNTYKLSDNGADALIDKAAMSSAADSTAAYQELNRYLTDNAWGAPVVTRLNTDVVSRDITVPLSNPVTPAVDPVAPQPELAWSPGRTH